MPRSKRFGYRESSTPEGGKNFSLMPKASRQEIKYYKEWLLGPSYYKNERLEAINFSEHNRSNAILTLDKLEDLEKKYLNISHGNRIRSFTHEIFDQLKKIMFNNKSFYHYLSNHIDNKKTNLDVQIEISESLYLIHDFCDRFESYALKHSQIIKIKC